MSAIDKLVADQHAYFAGNNTKDVLFRKKQLLLLKKALLAHKNELLDALAADLSKSRFEAYISEFFTAMDGLDYMLRNIKRLSKTRRVRASITQLPAKACVMQEPYGVVLIMSPWNYPLLLTLAPLIGALAAGNCATVKPSNMSPNVSGVITRMLRSIYEEQYVTVVEGGREENTALLEQKFDYIFFTGSPEVGRVVMAAAAKHLTPVTLELGGKSPCIVDDTADIKLAAKRIAWGKFLNAGQTCIAPDYVLVHESVKQSLLEELWRNVQNFYGAEPLRGEDLPKIITQKHYERLLSLLDGEEILYGGSANPATRRIEPTLLHKAGWDSPAMQAEIFGPILPVIGYTRLETEIDNIKARPKPLALYLFTTSKRNENMVLRSVSFGGGCVNDTISHFTSSTAPFGGVGESGMGRYHGKYTFDTFSHAKSILRKSNLLDIPVRYAPYSKPGLIKRMLMKVR